MRDDNDNMEQGNVKITYIEFMLVCRKKIKAKATKKSIILLGECNIVVCSILEKFSFLFLI